MYYKIYDDMGLERYYLSRTLEDLDAFRDDIVYGIDGEEEMPLD